MTIYLFWDAITLLFWNKKYRKIGYIFLGFFLFLLLAIRNPSMGLYDANLDGTYGKYFSLCKDISLIEAIQKSYSFEPLFSIYIWFLAQIGNYRFFLIVSAAISLLSIMKYIYDDSENPIMGIIVFFSLFYFYCFYLIKQILAISVYLFALKYLHQKKPIQFFAVIIICMLIHRSAIILVVMYIACKFIKINKHIFAVFVFTLLLGLYLSIVTPQFIFNLIYRVYPDYYVLIRDGLYSTGGKFNFSMIFYPAIVALCYYIHKSDVSCYQDYSSIDIRHNNKNKDLFIILFLGCIFNSWSTIVIEFYRIAIYFFIPICYMLPNSLEKMKRKYRNIIYGIMILILWAYGLKNASNTNCLKYIIM